MEKKWFLDFHTSLVIKVKNQSFPVKIEGDLSKLREEIS
jgi:hypothetical protein